MTTNSTDWYHRRLPACGTLVYDDQDPRHVGELVAIMHSSLAVIRWPNGWRSIIPLKRLRVANE